MPNPELSQKILQIGLLLCDDVPQDGRERFGDYTDMFGRGLAEVDNNINLTPYECYNGVLPDNLSTHDGYLISGSAASVFEDKEWIHQLMEFVRQSDKAGVRLVGICFGHQLIAHALGGKTERSDQGWGFGIHDTRLTNSPDWMEAETDRYKLIVIHQDQVVSLPRGFDTIASNDFCPNSMISNGDNMLGIQGHPEFSSDYCTYRAEARRELIGEQKYQETLELLANNEANSRQVLGWVSRFFRREKT